MSEVISGIYKITSPTGRIYIGQSHNIFERWKSYKRKECRGQRYIYHSLVKYGYEAHTFEVLEKIINPSQIKMDELEVLYINHFKKLGFDLMNIREGGMGGKMSKESIEKMRASLKGKRAWNKGLKGVVKMSEETRRKQSVAHKGKIPARNTRPRSIETIERFRRKMIGRKVSEETCLKISAALTGNPKAGLGGLKNSGKIRSVENRNKISMSLKRRVDNKGEFHNMAKLTWEKVIEIREKYVPNVYTSRMLAKEYEISKTNVLDIVNNRIWI